MSYVSLCLFLNRKQCIILYLRGLLAKPDKLHFNIKVRHHQGRIQDFQIEGVQKFMCPQRTSRGTKPGVHYGLAPGPV